MNEQPTVENWCPRAAMACMREVQLAVEEHRLGPDHAALQPPGAEVVRRLRAKDLAGVRSGCVAMIMVVRRLARGRYCWQIGATPAA